MILLYCVRNDVDERYMIHLCGAELNVDPGGYDPVETPLTTAVKFIETLPEDEKQVARRVFDLYERHLAAGPRSVNPSTRCINGQMVPL